MKQLPLARLCMTLQPGLRWLPQDGTLHWSRRWWRASVSFYWRHNMPTSLRQHIAGKAAYLRHIGCSTTPVVPKCSEGGARCKTSPIIVDQKGLFFRVYRKPHEYARVLVSHSLSYISHVHWLIPWFIHWQTFTISWARTLAHLSANKFTFSRICGP